MHICSTRYSLTVSLLLEFPVIYPAFSHFYLHPNTTLQTNTSLPVPHDIPLLEPRRITTSFVVVIHPFSHNWEESVMCPIRCCLRVKSQKSSSWSKHICANFFCGITLKCIILAEGKELTEKLVGINNNINKCLSIKSKEQIVTVSQNLYSQICQKCIIFLCLHFFRGTKRLETRINLDTFWMVEK